jgi:hypothetical protein
MCVCCSDTEWTTLYLHSHFSNVWFDVNQNWNLILIDSVLRKPYAVLSIGASYQMFVHLATVLQRRRLLCDFPIGSYVKLSSAVGAILVEGPNRLTYLKLLSQSQPNFAEMILGWSPSKFMSGISDLRPRWPDTILEEDHPMTILSKFGSNWATGSRQEDFYVNFP